MIKIIILLLGVNFNKIDPMKYIARSKDSLH